MSAFNKIAGYTKEKAELQSLVEIFNNRKKYESKGATLPKGIIFYGPSGTGKTLFAEVLAKECSMKKIVISISDSSSEHDICKRIKRAFAQGAKSKEPVMIFFDELDKVLPNDVEEYHTDRSKTILTQLLTLIDGMEKAGKIVFVATCNNYGELPESITRPGRFDKKICLDLPDATSRTAILKLYMGMSSTKFEMNAESISKLTGGFSPAGLKTLVNDCILVSDENNYISEAQLREKILEIKEEDIPTERSEQSYIIDAVRSIGSFLVARSYIDSDYFLNLDDDKVGNYFLDAVIEDGSYDDDDDYYDDEDEEWEEEDESDESTDISAISSHDYLAAITALLGGYAAEELIFKRIYTNLESALSSIDRILVKMSKCGMLGLDMVYDFECYEVSRYPERAKERMDEKFIQIRVECYGKAMEFLEKNEELIRFLVAALVSRKSIEKDECEALIEQFNASKQ